MNAENISISGVPETMLQTMYARAAYSPKHDHKFYDGLLEKNHRSVHPPRDLIAVEQEVDAFAQSPEKSLLLVNDTIQKRSHAGLNTVARPLNYSCSASDILFFVQNSGDCRSKKDCGSPFRYIPAISR